MSYFMIDIEADGPIPGDNSMIEFGAIMIDKNFELDRVFLGKLKPISDIWVPEALAISGYTREQTLNFYEPEQTMTWFRDWIRKTNQKGRPIFMSDNNGFDWMFSHWYFIHFLAEDPFGWSSRNLNDIYHGLEKNMWSSFKKLRKTKHTHKPIDDARGNAEALVHMIKEMGLRV